MLIVGVGVCAYFYSQMDEEIRQHAQRLLGEKLPTATAKIGSARRIDGRGIAFYDVELSLPASGAPDEAILAIDELVLHCSAELGSLVAGEFDVARVEIKHPRLRLNRSLRGQWNIGSLLPVEPCGSRLPPIVIRGGAITISDAQSLEQQVTLRDVNLTIDPSVSDVSPNQSATNPLSSRADRPSSAIEALPSLVVQGSLTGAQVRRFNFRVDVDATAKTVHGSAVVEQLRYGPELHAWALQALPPQLRNARVSGAVDGTATLDWRFAQGNVPDFDVKLAVSDGRVAHPKLPRPITEVHTDSSSENPGGISIDNGGVQIDRLVGRSETTHVALSLNRNGWSAAAPVAVSAQAGPIRLNSAIRSSLPEILQDQWDKYQPKGVVHARSLQAAYDGQKWRPVSVLLEGSELSFESVEKFPYRLRDGSGTIRYSPAAGEQPAVVNIDLTGIGGKQAIRIAGQVFNPQPGAAGWAEIKGENVEIDGAMIDALEGKEHDVIASLHPSGRFDFEWRLERDEPGGEPLTQLRLDLRGVDMQYDEFPYPLKNVRGVVQAQGKDWTFENLVAGGRKQISCQGSLRPIEPGIPGGQLYLNFAGQQIPLDEELFDAVPEPVQQAWLQLNPTGHFDLQAAEVRFRSGDSKPRISVRTSPREESAGIKPEFFPYEMKLLGGQIDYFDGQILLTGMRAEHAPTLIVASGGGRYDDAGAWEFELTKLQVDRLTPARRDLLIALPRQLSSIIDQLEPTGVFRVSDGTLRFRKSASSIEPVSAAWDFLLDCDMTDMQCGLELKNIFGAVRLRGAFDGRRSYCTGELNLESVTIQDYRLTNVQGPFLVDESQCLLGQFATVPQRLEPRRIRATAYQGVVEADASVKFLNQPKYEAYATLRNADLRQLMLERFGSQTQFRGKVDANVTLDGNGRRLEGVTGKGDLQIRDAELYEHSLFVGMLKMLRNKTPDTTAFNQCDVEFQLQGKDILLDKLNFLGDAVSLYGSGRANFDQQLSLAFHGQVVGRNEQFPIFNRFARQLSEQTMRMYVTGTIENPDVRTEALPGFNQFVQQVQADWEYPVFGPPTRQAQRSNQPTLQPNR